jgi:hypothetical protein
LVFEQEGAKSDRENEAEIFGPITGELLSATKFMIFSVWISHSEYREQTDWSV